MPVHYELAKRPGAEHVVLITLDRPEAKNACDLEHFHQLAQAWKRFEADDAAWVAIFTGVGSSYMSGADLKTYVPEITALAKELQAGTATSVKGYSLADGTDAVLRGTKIYKPIIAAVNGPCVAGGMEMLGGVDIRIAGQSATFGVLEPARGLFAGGGTTVRLPRQIPFAQAMEFLLCADIIDAPRAFEMGLLNAVVPDEELLDKAFEYAAGSPAMRRWRFRPPNEVCWRDSSSICARPTAMKRASPARSSPPRTPRKDPGPSPRSVHRSGPAPDGRWR